MKIREINCKLKQEKRNFDFPKNFRFWYYYGDKESLNVDEFVYFFTNRLNAVECTEELEMLVITYKELNTKISKIENIINDFCTNNKIKNTFIREE